jgi:hypothetical protein
MEHTNKFLMGMFAAYMGCKVQSKISGRTYKTIGISYRESCFIVCNGDRVSKGDLHLYPKDLMPILTPLSEITDAHKIMLAKIVRPEIVAVEHLLNIGNSVFLDIINGYTIIEVGAITFTNIIDYLRSKKYDCGYLHISSLIQARLAVNAPR